MWGENEFNTVKMLFEEYNAKGGIEVGGKKYMLEAIGYDNKGDAQEAVNVTKPPDRARTRSWPSSAPTPRATPSPSPPILKQAKVPDIATVATNPKVTVAGRQGQAVQLPRLLHRPLPGRRGRRLRLRQAQAPRRPRSSTTCPTTTPRASREFFVEDLQEATAARSSPRKSFTAGDKDFRAQLSKIKAAEPRHHLHALLLHRSGPLRQPGPRARHHRRP
ncbi:MAG: hypothetical protein MZV64_09370 [Ignavibacteriales bacterium]|nr:hypothetical protein [Ignavibacteriales bacterium]